ncbi:hypothetical protein GCM10023317_63730 [Actinopolymorpha pittospori]
MLAVGPVIAEKSLGQVAEQGGGKRVSEERRGSSTIRWAARAAAAVKAELLRVVTPETVT